MEQDRFDRQFPIDGAEQNVVMLQDVLAPNAEHRIESYYFVGNRELGKPGSLLVGLKLVESDRHVILKLNNTAAEQLARDILAAPR